MPNHSGQFGTGSGFDGFEFLKRMWGQSPMANAMPTTNLEELDKRIADLKAVEQWLNLNVTMLRTSIQGLEVQRGTIAALKTFGEQFGQPFAASSTNTESSSGSRANKDKKSQESFDKNNQKKDSTSENNMKSVVHSTQAMMAGATAWWSAFQEGLQTMLTDQQKSKDPVAAQQSSASEKDCVGAMSSGVNLKQGDLSFSSDDPASELKKTSTLTNIKPQKVPKSTGRQTKVKLQNKPNVGTQEKTSVVSNAIPKTLPKQTRS